MKLGDVREQLTAPWPWAAVSWRVVSTNKAKTSGQVAYYIDARDVMNRLDDVVGPDSWSDVMIPIGTEHIRCRLTVLGVTHDGLGDANDGGRADALKSAESDALKRAAVKFGIGRYLYAGKRLWVELDGERPATRELRRIQEHYALLVKGRATAEQGEPDVDEAPAERAQRPRTEPGNGMSSTDFWTATKGLGLTAGEVMDAAGVTSFRGWGPLQFGELYERLQKSRGVAA